MTWEFPKIRDTLLYSGVLIMRILLFRALYYGPLCSETLMHMVRSHVVLLYVRVCVCVVLPMYLWIKSFFPFVGDLPRFDGFCFRS